MRGGGRNQARLDALSVQNLFSRSGLERRRCTLLGMREKKICLRALMSTRDGRSVWSGEYICSICGQRFLPDAADPAKLTRDFEAHATEHSNGADEQ
jgi:hypothetical protein